MCRKCTVVEKMENVQFERDRKRYQQAKEEMCEWRRLLMSARPALSFELGAMRSGCCLAAGLSRAPCLRPAADPKPSVGGKPSLKRLNSGEKWEGSQSFYSSWK